MRLNRLCIVLAALLQEAFCKTIVEAPKTRDVEVKLEDNITTLKTIFDKSTAEVESEKGFENIFDGSIAPANELQDAEEGRTFGVKRLQFMMMPMIYKMGVMMTLLMVLTVISLKGLAIGVILLVLKLSAIFGKFYAMSHGPAHGWAPQPPQPVHVHVHNSGGGHHHPHPQPYSGWEPASGPPEDEHYYYKG